MINYKNNLSTAIVFLYTVEANEPLKNEAMLQAANKLKANGTKVQVLAYLPNKQTDKPNNDFCFFYKEDINFLGKSNNTELNDFFQTWFERLYHIDLVSDPILNYIVANSNAKYKIGNFISKRDYLFGISFKGLVQTEENDKFSKLIDKMFKYTEMLKI